MKIYQVLYFGLDNYGDTNGEIIEVGYCDEKEKAYEMALKDSFENEGVLKQVIITSKCARYDLITDIKSGKPDGFYQIREIAKNQVFNNLLAE